MGNLKIAKKLEVTNFQHNLIQLIDTKYNFYVGVTKDNNVATYGKKIMILEICCIHTQ